ncbi:MAG: hypothetical protein PVF68_13790 [Acidobacteriota bacterium]
MVRRGGRGRVHPLATFLVQAVVLPVCLVGCAPRGPAALDEARAALEAAWRACATEYAPEPFERAQQGLEALEAEVAARRGPAARAAGKETIRWSREAEREARRQVAVARAEAQVAIDEAEEALAKARAAGRAPGAGEVETAADRLRQAQHVLHASQCNYRRARALALEAISLASSADAETVAVRLR